MWDQTPSVECHARLHITQYSERRISLRDGDILLKVNNVYSEGLVTGPLGTCVQR